MADGLVGVAIAKAASYKREGAKVFVSGAGPCSGLPSLAVRVAFGFWKPPRVAWHCGKLLAPGRATWSQGSSAGVRLSNVTRIPGFKKGAGQQNPRVTCPRGTHSSPSNGCHLARSHPWLMQMWGYWLSWVNDNTDPKQPNSKRGRSSSEELRILL